MSAAADCSVRPSGCARRAAIQSRYGNVAALFGRNRCPGLWRDAGAISPPAVEKLHQALAAVSQRCLRAFGRR